MTLVLLSRSPLLPAFDWWVTSIPLLIVEWHWWFFHCNSQKRGGREKEKVREGEKGTGRRSRNQLQCTFGHLSFMRLAYRICPSRGEKRVFFSSSSSFSLFPLTFALFGFFRHFYRDTRCNWIAHCKCAKKKERERERERERVSILQSCRVVELLEYPLIRWQV